MPLKHFYKNLFLGKQHKKDKPKHNPIKKRILNILSIWNNDHQDDSGIEKIVRLLLSSSQLLFPGIYIKQLAHKINFEYEDITIDFYVVAKVVFPLIILINGWQNNIFIISIMIYLLLETFFYIPTLIFASDLFSRPRSYKRSMLLLFLNYAEVVIGFGVLYAMGNQMNKPFKHWFEPIYFSLITSNSIGYGDFYPITLLGRVLVSIQSMFFLSFVVLFLNFFSTKVKVKGYFDHEGES
ncbi:two pore domain potassium channel family protein [Flavobacterium columnare]|uniref:potassium channel family protein n=1 Tax=Flavobacterium columnare TaxID=996 RepID=UPI000D1B0545|nr:potassium channel family protein [Flavobacterium columnare]MBF6652366.1 two pore domain potassium channel family protein [Flavobacterium columnare]PTD15252.1 two pore domain potassium channel family protein [Flavobacterium columnare]